MKVPSHPGHGNVYGKYQIHHSNGKTPLKTNPVLLLVTAVTILSVSVYFFFCPLLSSDRMQQTARRQETAQPPAVVSNLIFSRIKHAAPSPPLWRTS